MIVHTITDLLQASVDSVPEAFRGKVKNVYTPRSGTSGAGNPYHLQKLILIDPQNPAAQIECVFSKRDPLGRNVEGSQIYVVAGRGEKGLTGTKRKEETYKDKVTQQVWVYESADVSFEGGKGTATPSTAQQQAPRTPTAPTNGHKPANGNGNGHTAAPPAAQGGIADKLAEREEVMAQFDIRLGKTSAALRRCFDASIALVDNVNGAYNGVLGKPTFDNYAHLAMGLLVNVAWNQKPGEVSAFPTKPFHVVRAKANAAPPAQPAGRQGQPFDGES
jgi:hypothetical protein